jgi:hypothetical protein
MSVKSWRFSCTAMGYGRRRLSHLELRGHRNTECIEQAESNPVGAVSVRYGHHSSGSSHFMFFDPIDAARSEMSRSPSGNYSAATFTKTNSRVAWRLGVSVEDDLVAILQKCPGFSTGQRNGRATAFG